MYLEDYDDDEIAEEFYLRVGDNNLIHEALTAMRQGRALDARTALERAIYPKWGSEAACQLAYDKAMGHGEQVAA